MNNNDIDLAYLAYIQSRKRAMAIDEAEREDTDKGFRKEGER